MSQSLKCSFSHTVDLSQALFLLGYYYGMKKLIYDSSITKFMDKVYEYYIDLRKNYPQCTKPSIIYLVSSLNSSLIRSLISLLILCVSTIESSPS